MKSQMYYVSQAENITNIILQQYEHSYLQTIPSPLLTTNTGQEQA